MRPLVLSRLAVGTVLFATALGAAEAPDGPHRKLGLWDQTISLDNGAYSLPESQVCLDAAAEARLAVVGAQMDQTKCSTYKMQRTGETRWAFQSVCALKGGAVVSTSGVIEGDFSSSYQVRGEGSTTGAPRAEMNGDHSIVVQARWLGACPAGQRGGDITSNGATANIFGAPKDAAPR